MYSILGFLLTIGLLVLIHEWGHFAVARLFDVKVTKFSIGFGKVLWKKQVGETEWCLSMIPLGGYVKMLGENANSEETIAPEDKDRSFEAKSVWKRMAIVSAGPGINIAFAALLFSIVAWVGTPDLSTKLDYATPKTQAAQMGIERGDRLVSLEGQRVESMSELLWAVTQEVGNDQVLARFENKERLIYERYFNLSALGLDEVSKSNPLEYLGLQPYLSSMKIQEVFSGSPAQLAGLKPGDTIVAINGQRSLPFRELIQLIRQSEGEPIDLTILSDSTERALRLTPEIKVLQEGEKVARLGVRFEVDLDRIMLSTPFPENILKGVEKTGSLIVMTLKSFVSLGKGEASLDNISGPIGIADYAGKAMSIGWISFIGFLALVSVSLGILNLLPVPVLDGGHLLFFVIEAMMGRPLSEKVRENASKVGLFLLLMLMVLALSNDFVNVFLQ